jgi:uncharacterized GH25 family protein
MAYFRIVGKLVLMLASLSLASTVTAHEFWVEPLEFKVETGKPIVAAIRNGQNFKGSSYSFINERFTRFDLVDASGSREVKGRRGDVPAAKVKPTQGGLHAFAYASTMRTVNYKTYEEFETFLKSKGLDKVLAEHSELELKGEKVREAYYRFAKALVQVGDDYGDDRSTGLRFEFVAEINPYESANTEGLPVRLLYEGEPFADADIQIFHFENGSEIAVKHHVTSGADGRVLIPAYDRGRFLINAVHIIEPGEEELAKKAQWTTLWASLTYELRE